MFISENIKGENKKYKTKSGSNFYDSNLFENPLMNEYQEKFKNSAKKNNFELNFLKDIISVPYLKNSDEEERSLEKKLFNKSVKFNIIDKSGNANEMRNSVVTSRKKGKFFIF